MNTAWLAVVAGVAMAVGGLCVWLGFELGRGRYRRTHATIDWASRPYDGIECPDRSSPGGQ